MVEINPQVSLSFYDNFFQSMCISPIPVSQKRKNDPTFQSSEVVKEHFKDDLDKWQILSLTKH